MYHGNRQKQSFPANITFKTEEELSTLEIYPGDLVKIIRSLHLN